MFGEQPGRRPSPAGVSPTAATHLTVRVEGVGQPLTSNLNLPAGDVRPNLVVVGLENFATIRIYNHAPTPAGGRRWSARRSGRP